MSDTPETIHDRIRGARQRARMTQAELAAAVGGWQSRISKLESDGVPTTQELRELSRALGVSADWLLGLPTQPAQDVA